jgi:CheY-like chemotaxis protein
MFSNSTSADATGIGIGLYLSKHLLNFLHGDLFIESKFNRGTDIMFWVPQENYEKVSDCDIPNKAPKIISFPSEIRGSFEHKIKPVIKESSNIGILVVDDNAMCLTVLKALLTQLNNYILFSAYNGKQAVDLYKENKNSIRLVLMDLNMPVLNGIDSCKEMLFLQQQNGWPFIDIVAVSAQDDYFYMKEANNAGMKAFLRKPVSLNALRSILNELKLL